METLGKVLGHNLIRLRGKRSIKEVAAASGVPYRSLQNMEYGILPRAEGLQKIAEFYGVPAGALLFEECKLPVIHPTISEELREQTSLIAIHAAREAIAEAAKHASTPASAAWYEELLTLSSALNDAQRKTILDWVRNYVAKARARQGGGRNGNPRPPLGQLVTKRRKLGV